MTENLDPSSLTLFPNAFETPRQVFFLAQKNFKGELRPINWHAIYNVKEEMPVSSHESWRKTRFTIANSSSSASLSYRRRHPPPQPHNHRNPDGNADPSLTIANPKKRRNSICHRNSYDTIVTLELH